MTIRWNACDIPKLLIFLLRSSLDLYLSVMCSVQLFCIKNWFILKEFNYLVVSSLIKVIFIDVIQFWITEE